MPDKRTILIVDDHALFREGLKAIISRDDHYEVVGETGLGETGLDLAMELAPDLVIVDISLPDISGVQIIRKIRRKSSATRILVVSMHSRIDYITAAFQAGATGYVVKESASAMLLQGLAAVLDGEYFMDSSVSRQVARKLIETPPEDAATIDSAYKALTPREQEVLPLLAEGIPTREIGKRLFISPKTVENHRASIMNKLDIHSSMELVRYAARYGLIDLDKWKIGLRQT